MNITIQRAKTDNHSGNQGNIVPNPVWDLIQLLATMKDNQGNILIDGFYENILPPRKDEERLIESLPFDGDSVISSTGMKSLPMDKNHYYKNLMFTPTFNIAGINSGYTGPGYKTIIPSKASVNIDARLVANQDPEFVFEKVQNHVKKHLPEAVCTLIGKVLPSRTRANHPYIAIIEESLHCVSDQDVLIQPSLGGTLPDYIWTKILGVPSILAPYANHDHKNHAANENISLTKFNNGILSTAYIIRNLGEI